MDDAPNDGQPKADAGLIRAHPFRATLERLGKRGDQFGVLLDAVRAAAVDAAAEEIAVVRYGSGAEAARWVATAQTSTHVHGGAVDVAPGAVTDWLSAHGAGYGLCLVYGNEPSHFEYLPDAGTAGCPCMYPNPTEDPRMNPA
nr:hypothetical protein [Arthrobacter gengyunqii]